MSSAANYTMQNKVNQEAAIVWIDKAIAQQTNYTNLNIKSSLLKQMGKTAEAENIQKEALVVATEVELNQYGYQLLNEGKHDDAIKIMVMVTDRFPQSANAWDSLGEAYATKGDKENAIKSFKKSLSLNPPKNVKDNSEKFLKQLGAMK